MQHHRSAMTEHKALRWQQAEQIIRTRPNKINEN